MRQEPRRLRPAGHEFPQNEPHPSKLLEPGDALAATAASDLEFVSSVPFGGAYVLDHLWRRLRIDQIVGRVGQPKRGRAGT
ncbi:hypothetical protein [Streptomyces sp. NPDC006668]|uniref:hypothetical protein n=1 Tax=Streptomyces sp. NPDC006668 TaxID=3156903 RepID=UPI0033C28B61